MEDSEHFAPRGIGQNWLACAICGAMKVGWERIGDGGHPTGQRAPSWIKPDGIHYHGAYYSCQPDLAAYVEDAAAGERVQAMFAAFMLKVFLDVRENEPGYVQVKVGACEHHLSFLKHLGALTSSNENRISIAILREVLTRTFGQSPPEEAP